MNRRSPGSTGSTSGWMLTSRSSTRASRRVATSRLPVGTTGCRTPTTAVAASRRATVLHQAIWAVVADGTTLVVAAGNDARNAALRQPAAYDEVITVSALAISTDGHVDTADRPPSARRTRPTRTTHSATSATSARRRPHRARQMHPLDVSRRALRMGDGHLDGVRPWWPGRPHWWRPRNPAARPGQIKAALIDAADGNWKKSTDPDGHPHGPPTLAPTSRVVC